jgi:hypothetical protein
MRLGFVVIGRNEGPRLRRCFESLPGPIERIVYVDSGSADDSVDVALAHGVRVTRLDPSRPFSPGRARNEGFAELLRRAPDLEAVHFVDGDCELFAGWVKEALSALERRPDAAAVSGRVCERYPDASVYNRLAQIEWTKPAGDVDACAGVAIFRVEPFRLEEGYHPLFISGEEPDLCARLRQRGYRIVRLDVDMAWHDAAMYHIGQWWRRCMRYGYGCAQASLCRGDMPSLRQAMSGVGWGLLLPGLGLSLAWPTVGLSLLPFALYPWLALRIAGHMRQEGFSGADSRLYGLYTLLSKLPQGLGSLRCVASAFIGRKPVLIEYKRRTT